MHMYSILENVDLKVNPVYPGLPILENIYKDFQDFNNIRTLTIVVYKTFGNIRRRQIQCVFLELVL